MSSMPICQCGCERPVSKPANRFLSGHSSIRCGGTPEQRFWRYVNKTDTCWLWTASTHGSNNYGQIGINKKNCHAHRFSFEIAYGPIPDGLLVLHMCDVPLCVRPDHLFLGTNQDNTNDALSKNRHVVQKHDWSFLPRGEKHYRAKLTTEDILEIRRSFDSSRPSILRKKFGISYTHLYKIVNGEYWKHLPTNDRPHISHLHGEQNPNTPLTTQDVLSIREKAQTHKVSAIAQEYNVTVQTIYNILKRKTWGHIP